MANNEFFGTLERVTVIDKKANNALSGGEGVIGCRVSFEFTQDGEGNPFVKVLSPNGVSFGGFSPEFSQTLTELHDSGRVCTGILSLVGFTDGEGYWGEFAVLAYNPDEADAWETFITTLAEKYAQGHRPDIDITQKTSRHIVETGGTWCDLKKAKDPKLKGGEAIVKRHRTARDNLVDQAVKGNKGCWVGTVVFWVAVAALIVFLVWKFLIH